ncbi:hypothetical protein N0B44_18255 [Roseibacterium beibuensis]|uniref:hypothetical protein n=1 Tax=[Roseibacterium] beibuensis TaxID=1193142 RepID=UPI00217D9D84|nr:hypothetical protein [Roseibacterium beibuensis]MCS6624862.1 hypothetical protein [Roseibacterium beibuensis]
MFDSIHVQIGMTLAVLVVGFMFIKGDEPEKVAGGFYMLISLAGVFTEEIRDGPLWGRMALDGLQLAVFVGLVVHSRRGWLVWASAFQALIVTGHVLVAANLRPPLGAFAAMNNVSNYAVLVAMAVGTFWAWQDRRAAAMSSGGKL